MSTYSARNPIPNAAKFAQTMQEKLKLQKSSGQQVTDQAGDDEIKGKNRRTVVDPVTKSNVIIQDIESDFEASVRKPEETIPLANVHPNIDPVSPRDVPNADMPAVPMGSGEQYRAIMDELAPPEANRSTTKEFSLKDRKTNVLYHPMPAADLSNAFNTLEDALNKVTIAVIFGTVLLNWLFVGGKWKGLIGSVFAGVIISVALHLWLRKIQQDANDKNWESEKKRAEYATQSLMPESVEWLNNMIGTIWQLINPEMFNAVADTLEDVMQASVPPSIIENVKVSAIDQGKNPLKILSLRSLPDATGQDNKLNENETQDERDKKAKDRAQEEDQDSKYYNLEASFAYHALPAKGVASKAQNIHLEIAFYLGVKGLFGVPLPIFAELQGIVGTVRLRFQMTPNPPFIKNLSFTFMGLPKLNVSVVPMTQKGINVLNLPLISGFVNNAIAAAIDEYVAPKSLTMDISQLLEGDAVKKETDAIGAIYIKIKNAVGLPKMDRMGKSDTYITIAYSQFGKPMYCTRVIAKDLNPSWEEDTCILVHQEELKAGEKLSIQLWDSDRLGSDEMVGRIEFDLHEILDKDGKMLKRSDKLNAEKDGKEVPGVLNWEVGYYSRQDFKKAMRTTGEDVNLPKELRGKDEFQDPSGVSDTTEQTLALHVPPDPNYPTGIVSVILHQINHLEFERPAGSFGKIRPFSPAQIVGENKDEEGSSLPSAYCTVMVNDSLSFKSRTKVKSSNPIFNAETERFVRDWRNAVITIGVRDSRYREHDPLIGACVLKLSDVLQTSSQVTRTYALDGGMGYGLIQVSLLFRSIKLQLPKNLLGWDVGSIEIMDDKMSVSGTGAANLTGARLIMKTDVGSAKVHRKWANKDSTWDLAGNTIRLPVRQRYGSSLVIEFHTKGHRKAVGHGLLWLNDILDNQTTTLDIPVYKTNDALQLTQNYAEDSSDREHLDADLIGKLQVTLRFKDGLDESHRVYIQSDDDRESMDTFEACLAEGSRGRIVKRETGATVKHLVSTGATEVSDSDYEEEIKEKAAKKRRAAGLIAESENSRSMQGDEQDETLAAAWAAEITPVVDDDEYSGSDHDSTFEKAGDDSASIDARHDIDSASDSSDGEGEGERDPDAKRAKKERIMMEKRQQHRKLRGIMHFKPARNVMFFKDELKMKTKSFKNKFALKGRKPDVESEISQAQ